MNPNQTVLEALAHEGIVTTEEAFLRAAAKGNTDSAPASGTGGLPSLDTWSS